MSHIAHAAAVQQETQQNAAGALQFLRPHLLKLAPYTPIEPFEILSARYGRTPDQIVKLDANENPYGPPPEVREALGSMPFPHIYPDPETRRLRKALAETSGVPIEHILVRDSGINHTAQSGLAIMNCCSKLDCPI
jgi:histidinol-phosphate aminotransferase